MIQELLTSRSPAVYARDAEALRNESFIKVLNVGDEVEEVLPRRARRQPSPIRAHADRDFAVAMLEITSFWRGDVSKFVLRPLLDQPAARRRI